MGTLRNFILNISNFEEIKNLEDQKKFGPGRLTHIITIKTFWGENEHWNEWKDRINNWHKGVFVLSSFALW